MKKVLALLLALIFVLTPVLTSCIFDNNPSEGTHSVKRENGESIEIQQLYQTSEKNENFLDTEVSWYDDVYNYYVYYIGKIKNVPLTTTYSIFTYSGAELSVESSISKASEKSIETTTQQAITKTVETATSNEFNIKGSVGTSEKQAVQASIEMGYSRQTTNGSSTSDMWSQTYRECVTSSESETNTITVTFDESCAHGNYLYLYLGNLKVYYVVLQSRENPHEYYVETMTSVESHKYALIYTGESEEFPIDAESKIKIDPSFIGDLEEPTKYIEGLKPTVSFDPITGTKYYSGTTDIKGYVSNGSKYEIPGLADYFKKGYNKIEITYEFHATAEKKLFNNSPIEVTVYLSKDKTDNAFYSNTTSVTTSGTNIKATTTTDLEWLVANESFNIWVFNGHNPVLSLGDRLVSVTSLKLSYKIYKA